MLKLPTISAPGIFTMEVNHKRDIKIIFSDIFIYLKDKFDSKIIIFIDPAVLVNQDQFLELELIAPNLLLVPTNISEGNKSFDSLNSVLEILESQGIGRRDDTVCAVGGGALLDTVSFATSIFRRGINVVKVPTTLLGIVDAAIGIKTGINYLGQRNRLGSYHFNFTVIVDPKLMKGLRRGLVRQGLGEIFKIAVIKSKKLFKEIEKYKDQLEEVDFYQTLEGNSILQKSIQLMLEELHENPMEENLKRCVDYGHSFSPLVEMESLKRPNSRSLPHGYAVAYDCALTATISQQRGLIDANIYNEIILLFFSVNFDFGNEIYLDYNLLWSSFLEMTKHRGGNQNLPIPINLGSYAFLQDVTFEEMQKSCIKLRENFQSSRSG